MTGKEEQELKDLVFRGAFIVILIYLLVYVYNKGVLQGLAYNLQTKIKKEKHANTIKDKNQTPPAKDFFQPESTQSYNKDDEQNDNE